MADCPNPAAQLVLQSRTRVPLGFPGAQLLVYASNGRTLDAPYDRGLILGIVADEQTGTLTVDLSNSGEPTRRVSVPLGNALLWKLRADGPRLVTAGTQLADARPWPLGGGEEAVRSALTQARAELPGALLAYWAIGDPSVRAQVETAASRQGIRPLILNAFDVRVIGRTTHPCSPGEQPIQPHTPPQPDTNDVIVERPTQAESGARWPFFLGAGAVLVTLAVLWYKGRK